MTSLDRRKKRSERFRTRLARGVKIPRITVFRSAKNIYGQIVLDGATLVSASSLEKDIRGKNCTVDIARIVGENIAKRAKKQGLKKVIFDRSGFLYHGKIRALAEGARKGGLEF